MAAVATGLAVSLSSIGASTAARLADDLRGLGATAYSVGPPADVGSSGAMTEVAPGAAARGAEISGATGSLLANTTDGVRIRSGPVAASVTATLPLVGVEWAGEVPGLTMSRGEFRLDPQLPLAVVGPRAAELLGLDRYPAVVFANDHAIVVTGVIAGDSVHVELARSLLVDDRWYAKNFQGQRKLIVWTVNQTIEVDDLRAAANPVESDALSVTIPASLGAALAASSYTLAGSALITVGVGYGAAMLAVFLLFLSLVRARTAEIGVRRCFGASVGSIAASTLAEGLIVGVIGVVLGAIGGASIAATWSRFADLPWVFPYDTATSAALVGLAAVVAASVPSAVLAARTDPAIAVSTAV